MEDPEEHDSEEFENYSEAVDVTPLTTEEPFDFGTMATIIKEQCVQDKANGSPSYENTSSAVDVFVKDEPHVDPLAIVKVELEEETDEDESIEDAPDNEQELGHVGEQWEIINTANHHLISQPCENESQEEFILPVSRNNIGVLDSSLLMRMPPSQLQIRPSQIEGTANGVWMREKITKRVIFRPYLDSSLSKPNNNEYGKDLGINVTSNHWKTKSFGKKDVKVIRDNKLPVKEGSSGREEGDCGENATSSISTKWSESHRKRSRSATRAADAESYIIKDNREDKLSPKRSEYDSSAEGRPRVNIARCEVGLPYSVRGECIERWDGVRGGEVNRHGGRGTASEKEVGGIGTRRYVCDLCGSVLTIKKSLIRHLACHGFGSCYACEVCDKQFGSKSGLIRHKRIHTGEKPYKCSQCSMCFAENAHLNCHMRIHTGEKPYKCTECGAQFAQYSGYKRHMTTHTGDKPFKCDTCCKAFTRSTNLKAHSRVHTGETPFQCHKCFKRFRDKRHLDRHLKNNCTERKVRSKK